MERERHVVEGAVQAVAEEATAADRLIDEALAAGLDGSHALTVHAKMLRTELLRVKVDLERELVSNPLAIRSGMSHQ